MRALSTMLAVSCAGVGPLSAWQSALAGDLGARADSLFAEYDRPWSPGCAAGVMQAGRLVWRGGYGMADLEHGVVIDEGTVFRLGSVSKQFTAAAVAQLILESRLSLLDAIQTYLPDFPTYEQPITVAHLLHHASGIRDYGGLMFLAGAGVDAVYGGEEVYRMLLRQRGLDFTPGSAYGYSNSNYFLLARIVEAVTGERFSRHLERGVFIPLGMLSTRVQDDHTRLVPGRAVGYQPSEGGDRYRLNDTWITVVGAANVFTTIGDMARWDRYVDSLSLEVATLADLLLKPGRLSSGEPVNYGAGWQLGTYRGLRTAGHAGAFAGYRADYVRFPDERLGVVALCNLSSAAPWTATRRIAEVVLGDRMQAATPSPTPSPRERPPTGPARIVARAADYEGRYRSEELDAEYRIERGRDSLSLVLPQGLRLGLAPGESEDVLQAALPPGPLTFRFTRDAAGRVSGFLVGAVRLGGIRFERLPPE